MITGQWSHNNGVTTNNPRLYDPSDNLSIKVREAGYHTIFGGKFLIKMERHFPARADVQPLARGWDQYDLIWKRTSKAKAYFYRYLLWTRAGTIYHGAKARDHSTKVVAQRIERFTGIVGADRVIAGSDCGFGTFAGFGAVDPDIAYAKLKTLAEGAAITSARS